MGFSYNPINQAFGSGTTERMGQQSPSLDSSQISGGISHALGQGWNWLTNPDTINRGLYLAGLSLGGPVGLGAAGLMAPLFQHNQALSMKNLWDNMAYYMKYPRAYGTDVLNMSNTRNAHAAEANNEANIAARNASIQARQLGMGLGLPGGATAGAETMATNDTLKQYAQWQAEQERMQEEAAQNNFGSMMSLATLLARLV